MNKIILLKQALINSLGTLAYCGLVAYIMINGEELFGKISNIFGIMAFLMLFVLSAAIVGSLVLGKPIIYYLDGKKKESITLLIYTIVILFILTAIILGLFTLGVWR